LRSLSDANEWNEENTFTVIISQPWYNTWWAWMLYILSVAALIWYAYRNWKYRFDLHQQMKLQSQISDFRLQFFTNIAHEFRTPLAIIKHGVDKLEHTADVDGQHALHSSISRGTTRLLRLVNQFLEYRQANTGKLHLHVSQGDIVALCRDIAHDFWSMTHQKDISLTLLPFAKSHPMVFDREKVETIVYNLLSNAVKYTPQGGTVDIKLLLSDNGQQVSIVVEDSGPGISSSQQEALFQPFMQGLASQGGMGIGLYTAHKMAEVHHGSLTYERSLRLGGSCFVLLLPATADGYTEDDYATADSSTRSDSREPLEQIIKELQPKALNDVTIAVIEDDPDMMEQICGELGCYFHIDRYANGQQGYEGVVAQKPALVVTDVMLPDMDGYQIVRRLRASADTASLPTIMLTALDDEQHQIRAYQAGADDYMVKPCNYRLLIARAMQLIKWREESGERRAESEEQPTVHAQQKADSLVTSQADRVFVDKLEMLVAQHLSEEDFSVDQLAQLMKMGRTKFYGKVKELTGLSPNKYLMAQRMQKAADLLADGELNVSEVSYRVGLQDPSYFNRCFKAYYGVVPSKYKR